MCVLNASLFSTLALFNTLALSCPLSLHKGTSSSHDEMLIADCGGGGHRDRSGFCNWGTGISLAEGSFGLVSVVSFMVLPRYEQGAYLGIGISVVSALVVVYPMLPVLMALLVLAVFRLVLFSVVVFYATFTTL